MIQISLENFTGPMDLLLSLVEKQNENIYNVNICSVIDQYIEAVGKGDQDMDSLSDFILFAARLLEIKAYMLLPPGEEVEEADPAEELTRHLAEYKVYKTLSFRLRECFEKAGETYVREPSIQDILKRDEVIRLMVEDALNGITAHDLAHIYYSLMEEKEKRGDPDPPRPVQMKKDDASFDDIKQNVSTFISRNPECHFTDIPISKKNRNSKIMSFLSILELSREGEILITQDQSDILIKNLPFQSRSE